MPTLLRKGRASSSSGSNAALVLPLNDTSAKVDAKPTSQWIDKYAPRSGGELAMHKKKVDEVRQWLKKADTSLQLGLPPVPRLLVLSGPPGSGKSTMLRVLAAELQFERCEWVEPRFEPWSSSNPDEKQQLHPRAASFAMFLRNSLRTLSLCTEPSSDMGTTTHQQDGGTQVGRRRLIILDDLAPVARGKSDRSSDLHEKQIVCLTAS